MRLRTGAESMEHVLERMKRLDSSRKIADFMAKEQFTKGGIPIE